MKIVLDHQIFTLQSYGGISRYFVRLMQGLIAVAHQIDVIAPIHRNRYLRDLPPDRVHGVELERFPPKTGRLMMVVNDHLSKIKMRGMCPDVLHETYYSPRKLCQTAKGRVITVYDMIHEKFASEFSLKDPTTKYKRAAVSRADHVICISQSTKKDLCEIFDVPENKVTVIHLGFEKFQHSGSPADSSTDVHLRRPFLLYVGSRSGYKNFARMLKAVAARSALKHSFDIVAFGGGSFSAAELTLINALGFASNSVRQVSGGDTVLGWLYEHAAAFVYPSLYEGFGLPPLEAMAHNCSVVTSNSSSMPEVVGDAGEYFDPLDLDGQADAICNVVFDIKRSNQLIELGGKRLAMFSWEHCALETFSVYQKVLQEKSLH